MLPLKVDNTERSTENVNRGWPKTATDTDGKHFCDIWRFLKKENGKTINRAAWGRGVNLLNNVLTSLLVM